MCILLTVFAVKETIAFYGYRLDSNFSFTKINVANTAILALLPILLVIVFTKLKKSLIITVLIATFIQLTIQDNDQIRLDKMTSRTYK